MRSGARPVRPPTSPAAEAILASPVSRLDDNGMTLTWGHGEQWFIPKVEVLMVHRITEHYLRRYGAWDPYGREVRFTPREE